MHHIVRDHDQVIITPDADIVASQEPALRATLTQAIEQGNTRIVLDLQHVEMVDSCGLGVLISVQNSLQAQGGKLTVSNVSAPLLRMFRLMRLDRHFAVTARANATV